MQNHPARYRPPLRPSHTRSRLQTFEKFLATKAVFRTSCSITLIALKVTSIAYKKYALATNISTFEIIGTAVDETAGYKATGQPHHISETISCFLVMKLVN